MFEMIESLSCQVYFILKRSFSGVTCGLTTKVVLDTPLLPGPRIGHLQTAIASLWKEAS